MMLRSLVNEVVRRRLWPIALAALLIIVAAPLLFMHSAPSDAPTASQAPPAAAPGKLPAGAAKLVTTSDKAVTPRHRTSATADPFAPPAAAAQAVAAAAAAANAPAVSSSAKGSSSSGATTNATGRLTITNSNGTTTTISTKRKSSARKKTSTAKQSTPKAPAPKLTKVSAPVDVVNVRFGPTRNSHVRRAIPRLQTFSAAGKVAAMFVKYSPARHTAVFAVAPSTLVTGDVQCRRKAGVCRYVDLPAGKHVWLSMRATDGSVTSRRLDVVSIHHVSPAVAAGATTSAPAVAPLATPLAEAKCLLKGLLSLPAILPSLAINACE